MMTEGEWRASVPRELRVARMSAMLGLLCFMMANQGRAGFLFYAVVIALAAFQALLALRLGWSIFFFMMPGVLCNLVAVAANGGYMPVRPDYYLAAGNACLRGSVWTPLGFGVRLSFLTDVLPGGSSIGDWMLAAGGSVTIFIAIRKAVKATAMKSGEVLKD